MRIINLLLLILIFGIPFVSSTFEYYPEPFIRDGSFNGDIIIGQNADSYDRKAASDISNSLRYTVPNEVILIPSEKKEGQIEDITSINAILIGNPCNNGIVRELFGLSENDQCRKDFSNGIGKLILFEHNGYSILIVAGFLGEDTYLAARALAMYKNYPFAGNYVLVEEGGDQCYRGICIQNKPLPIEYREKFMSYIETHKPVKVCLPMFSKLKNKTIENGYITISQDCSYVGDECKLECKDREWIVTCYLGYQQIGSGESSSCGNICNDKDTDSFGKGCEKGDDCNDDNFDINPNSVEKCNQIDDNCNNQIDEGNICQTNVEKNENTQSKITGNVVQNVKKVPKFSLKVILFIIGAVIILILCYIGGLKLGKSYTKVNCPKCNNKMKKDWKACPNCGHGIR